MSAAPRHRAHARGDVVAWRGTTARLVKSIHNGTGMWLAVVHNNRIIIHLEG